MKTIENIRDSLSDALDAATKSRSAELNLAILLEAVSNAIYDLTLRVAKHNKNQLRDRKAATA